MAELGCPEIYQVLVYEENANLNPITGTATFGRTVGELDGMTEFEWDRRLDDTSEAKFTVATNAECCTSGFISELHVWHHGVAIYRDGELVWDGPIVLIEATRTEVVITANDISVLLTKRLLSRDLCFSNDVMVCTAGVGGIVYGPQAPETVAALLIQEALRVDAHGAFVDIVSTSSTLYEASYKQYGGPVFDLLQKLATDFINWTVLGRRIVISVGGMLVGADIARTELLTCDDFLNDNFKVTEDGFATLTQDVQLSNVLVNGGAEIPNGNVGIGQVFLVTEVADPYYGLLQGVQRADPSSQVGSTPNAVLAQAAQNIVDGAYPPPVSLSADNMQLSPLAPVAIGDLVPGVIVPVFANCLCREVSQEFILSKVSVTVTTTGESVVPTFISRGADNPGTREEIFGG